MNKFLITSFEVLFISYFVSGCSLLQNRYADRSRIEEDRSTVVSTGSGQSKIEEAVTYRKDENGNVVLGAGSGTDQPLVTEANVVDNTVSQPSVAASETAGNETKPIQSVEVKTEPAEPTVEAVTSVKYVADTKVRETALQEASKSMIPDSYSKMPNNSVVYVETVACDPPLVYNTDKLTQQIVSSYSGAGKFRMASDESIRSLRSKMEYNDVANGDWSSLASLARAQKYDYVFYGAVGKENSGLYLMYYLIRVDSGEIVWESTKSLK